MRKRLKLGKLLAVIFLTALIWVWADLRQDEEYPLEGAKITAAKPDDLWVRLNGEDGVTIDEVVLKGPLSNINALKAKEVAGTFQPTFFYDPKKEQTVGELLQVDVAGFIAGQPEIKGLGVSVESCKPESITVNITPLKPQTCRIEAINEFDAPLTEAKIETSKIKMHVPETWSGGSLVAYVELTEDEIAQAQTEPVEKKPFIRLDENQTRTANETVRVTLPAQGTDMREYKSVPVVLYIAYNQNMHEKYKAEVENLSDLSSVNILATRQACDAYKDQDKGDKPVPQITLYVHEGDLKEQPPISRDVVYNFPRDYVRKGQIDILGRPAQAKFKLVKIGSQSPQ